MFSLHEHNQCDSPFAAHGELHSEEDDMSSNPAGQYGQRNPGLSQQDFMQRGLNHDAANEAAAAARREQERRNQQK